MSRRFIPIAALSLFASAPANAQIIVHDPTSHASLIREAQTALDQLNELKAQVGEAKRLYDGFNTRFGAGPLASLLNTPQLHACAELQKRRP